MEPEHVKDTVEPAVDGNGTGDNVASTVENDSPFYPTAVVLAKVKGYPPWPAMVLDESILPEHIIKKKPKHVKGPKSKTAKPIGIVPVRFFSDDTYIWIKTNEIKPLTSEMIESFLTKPSKRKDNLLESAYNLAKNPLDMQLFVNYGSSGKPPPEPEYIPEPKEDSAEEISEDDEYEEPAKKKKKSGPKPKEPQAKKRGKPGPKPKAEPKTKGKPGPKAKAKPKEPVDEDPDWGVDVDMEEVYNQGNYIFEDKEEQMHFQTHFPKSDDISKALHIKSNEFYDVSDKLMDQLLKDEQKGVDQAIALLRKLTHQSFPKALVVKSKLFKLLVVTNRKPISGELREVIDKVLQKWGDIKVEENPELETVDNTPEPGVKEENIPETSEENAPDNLEDNVPDNSEENVPQQSSEENVPELKTDQQQQPEQLVVNGNH